MLDKFLKMTGIAPPRGIVHVGAHHGQEIGEYQSYAPDLLIWVEADPRLYTELQDYLSQYNLPDTAQWCLNALVSDTDGEIQDFHLAGNNGQSSSMFPFTDLISKNYPEAAPTGEVMRLETKTIRKLLSEMDLTPEQVDYLVLDTQGAEMKCLKGADPYLDGLSYLTAEASTIELYQGGAQLHELDEYLKRYDFLRISGDPIHGHSNALYLKIDELKEIPESEVGSEFISRNRELIDRVNGIITRTNGDRRQLDLSELDEEVSTLCGDYEAVFAEEDSWPLKIFLLRISFDLDLSRSFRAFLPLVGWGR